MKSVYFDVDNTIVYPAAEFPNLRHLPSIYLGAREFYVNTRIVDKIKDFDARGHVVHVWSAGGVKWAAEVVRACGLESHVLHILSKPDWTFDDKPCAEWMPPSEHLAPHEERLMVTRDQFTEILGMGTALANAPRTEPLSRAIDRLWKNLLDPKISD